MPPPIPDRYRLEVRLGRDADIEEWLATDTSLDRPVLIRALGPETSAERRRSFVDAVTAAARITHPHMVRVFTAAEVEGGAYSVSEWSGGASLADRIEAEHPIELPDFLPNATGLASALAALHEAGSTHGRIDPSAIAYSGAHAAKLGSFGRDGKGGADDDVRSLAAALETGLTGSSPGGPPPSERVDGVPTALDRIIRSAQSGQMTARQLEQSLAAAPTPRVPQPESSATSRRLILAAAGLVVLAIALVAVGFFLSGGSTPIIPPSPTVGSDGSSTTTSLVTTTQRPGSVVTSEPLTLDPFGEGGENDQLLDALLDNNIATEWRTERYRDPLPLLKPGVGVTFRVQGTPSRVELVGLDEGTVFAVHWAENRFEDPQAWERVISANASPSATQLDLPPRENGYWLIWITDLPIQADGTYLTTLSEVRFSS